MASSRINRVFETRLNSTPARVFPLLCPVREYEWIPQWQCEMIYSESGVAELGCVFSTDFNDGLGTEVWVVSHFEPDSKIGFVRIGPARTTRYVIELKPEGDGSIISWRQEITSLNDQDLRSLEAHSEAKYKALMTNLNKMLDHFLRHGTPLDIDASRVHNKRKTGEEDESISR